MRHTLAMLACLVLFGQAHAYGQAQIRFPTPDPTAAGPTVTAPPATYPSYGNCAGRPQCRCVALEHDAVRTGSGSECGADASAWRIRRATAGRHDLLARPRGHARPHGNFRCSAAAPELRSLCAAGRGARGGRPARPVLRQSAMSAAGNIHAAANDRQLPALDVSIDYHWFAGKGDTTDQLGINDINLFATLALPIPWFTQQQPAAPQQQPQESLLLITPGFAWHYWAGPASTASDGFADMPARTYDAYLQVDWNPVIVPGAFSAELEASYGIYSDFTTLTNQSYRFKGKGMAVIGIPDTKLQMKLGVWYIDRGLIKLLPAAVWCGRRFSSTRFDILFPNPKFTQMLYTAPGGTEWWWYLSGDYGGGVWTIKCSDFAPPSEVGHIDLVDYNDIRFALGVDFKRPGGTTGFFEAGYAFDRQLVYASQMPDTFTPNGTFYLHSGFTF